MPFVKRNAQGIVTARAASRQEGWPVEFLPDNHPDLAASFDAERLSALKRAAILAVRVKQDEAALAVALNDPNAPQAVKDYKAAKA